MWWLTVERAKSVLIASSTAMIASRFPTKGGPMAVNTAVVTALILNGQVDVAVAITAAVLLLPFATRRGTRQQSPEATRAPRGAETSWIHPDRR